MNKQRREEISNLISEIEGLKDKAEQIASEEREYYDNMPENMQQGDKGQAADEAAGYLEEVSDSLQEAIDKLDRAVSQ